MLSQLALKCGRVSSTGLPKMALSSRSLSLPTASSSSDAQAGDWWPSMLSLGESTGTVASMQAELQVVEDRRQESYTSEPRELNEPNQQQQQQDAYSNSSNGGNLSLSCVMQSNSPSPYSNDNRSPIHLNMPMGGVQLQNKYLSGARQTLRQPRN